MTAALRHAADCRGADLQATAGRLGGLVIRCRTCARFVLLGATDATAEAVGAAGPAVGSRPAPRPPRARQAPQDAPGSVPLLIPEYEGPGRRHGDRWPTQRDKARKSARNDRSR